MATPIDISEQAGVRFLHFGSTWVQGAMRIARPWSLELDYTREMMLCLLLRSRAECASPWPHKVLLIGLGAASLTKFLYRHCPQAELTVVEIEPAVVAAARQFFKLPDDPSRLRIELGEGCAYLASSLRLFDLILVDGFDAKARTGVLDTGPFYQLCRSRLSDHGLLVANLLARNRGFKGSVERIRDAFEGRAFALPSCDTGNAIAFAATGEAICFEPNELNELAKKLRHDTGLNLLPTLSRLAQVRPGTRGRVEL